jgi:hypothetical protein
VRRTETLDAYTRRARLAPALLAATPGLAVIAASALSPGTTVRVLGVALGAVGLAVCGLVRDRGRQIEPGLWASWGGNPTVQRLRWREAEDHEAVRRLHGRLNELLDDPLPDEGTEADNPAAADRRYDEAVAVLRERTRDTSRFRLVFAENMEYGFRRNALGLRPFALVIAGVAFVLSVGLLIWGHGDQAGRWTRWGISAAISSLSIFYWWRVVTPEWVHRPAELYADRLLGAVEALRAAGPGPTAG